MICLAPQPEYLGDAQARRRAWSPQQVFISRLRVSLPTSQRINTSREGYLLQTLAPIHSSTICGASRDANVGWASLVGSGMKLSNSPTLVVNFIHSKMDVLVREGSLCFIENFPHDIVRVILHWVQHLVSCKVRVSWGASTLFAIACCQKFCKSGYLSR